MKQTISFTRLDTSDVGRWWWTVDRWILGALIVLIGIGILLTLAASPSVARRIGVSSFHFVYHHAIFVPVAIGVLWFVSLQTHYAIYRLGMVLFVVTVGLMVLTLVVGEEINGATRWINLANFSLQPSEFVKPTFAVVTAWILAKNRSNNSVFPDDLLIVALYSGVIVLLLSQPDVGMSLVVSFVWATQYFIAGLNLSLVLLLIMSGVSLGVGAYFLFDHVHSRVDRFLDPDSGDSYQIIKALQAFRKGGLTGTGPGEGRVKEVLPDAHTDFIFAVAGEEFGLGLCIVILGLFVFIVLRGFSRVFQSKSLFVLLATSGLLTQFGLQAVINMASSLRLIPTKGMTLPFISYGGSSMIALALGMGMVLALTRHRAGGIELP